MRTILPWPALLLALPACATNPNDRSPVESAATQPLRDTRLVDDRIPEALQRAAAAPYSAQGLGGCAPIGAEIRQLDAALGPDADAPGTEPGRGAAVAAAATRAAMSAIIPGLGLVRVVSGADRQEQRVEAAIHAGSIRRAYLKGLGAARGCAPPAAPAI
ncbi:hypothetical protein [Sphingosinicella terrae]|uniref:hypothetical protein n=1 Tax=Sphingosinicella terrae TaxID=2172047 RepID=UPI000E0CD2D8|nr:hypothetical protein [Sphingosinicella terrae]